MNDVERDLRELFEHKASQAHVSVRAPAPVLKRAGRRQVGTVVVSSLTLIAVVAVSIAGVRGLLRGSDDEIPAGPSREPFSRTATIRGFTVTSPSDWLLVDQWPLATAIAASSSSSGSVTCTGTAPVVGASGSAGEETCTSNPPTIEPVPIPTGLPVLQLTNFDPGIEETICSPGSAAETGTNAGLYVAIDADRLQGVTSGSELPAWPVPYDQSGRIDESGPCGAGWYEHFRVGDVPYMGFLTYGTPAPHEALRTLIDAFESMSATSVPFQGSLEARPGYVVAGGTRSGSDWRIEVRPSGDNVDIHLIVDEQGGPGVADFGVPGSANIEFSGGDPTFGAVTTEAEAVELRPSDGTAPIPGTIFGLPSSLNAPFDGFFIETGGVAGDVVAIGPEGDLPRNTTGGTTTDPPAVGTVSAEESKAALRNALVAAKTYFTDSATYEGFTPKVAASIEPSISFNDAASTVAGEVSIRDAAPSTVLLVTRAGAGATFCIADDVEAGTTTYGVIDAKRAQECNGTIDLWSNSGGVLTSTPPPVDGELSESLAGFGQVAALRIYRDENGFCLEFQSGSTGSGECGTDPFRSDRPYLALNRVEGGEGVWLDGTVPAAVELVRIVTDDGRKWTIDLTGPAPGPELGDVQLLLVALDGTYGSGSISFEDGNGQELFDAIAFDWPIPTDSGNEVL
jgi:hypothetical protein